MKPHPSNTHWKPNSKSDLLRVGDGMDYWTNIAVAANNFLLSVGDVAQLMSQAFQEGMSAKQRELKQVLGVA